MLLDDEGHLKITDFGLACILKEEDKRRTRGQAGTRGYMAPETMTLTGYGLSVDYFSLGVMTYELLHGQRPWKAIDANMAMLAIDGEVDPLAQVKRASLSCPPTPPKDEDEDEGDVDEIRFSSRLSAEARSLLIGLLEFKPGERLGAKRGWEEVKAHPFFKDVDWAAMQAMGVKPPFQPDLTHANCTPDADLADQLLDKTPKRIKDEEQKVFDGWSWNTKIRHEDVTAVTGPGGAGVVGGMAVVAGPGAGPGAVVEVKLREEKEGASEDVREVSPVSPIIPVASDPAPVTSVEVAQDPALVSVKDEQWEEKALEEGDSSLITPVLAEATVTLVSPVSPVTSSVSPPNPPRVLAPRSTSQASPTVQRESGAESHWRSTSTGATSPVGAEGGVGEGLKRRSTLKEKRQLHPMVSSEARDHVRTDSAPVVSPVL